MRTFIRVVIVLVVLAGGLGFGVNWWMQRSGVAQAQPDVVRVESAVRGSLVEFISAPGEVDPKSKVSISARVSARIAQLPKKEGDPVKKGDLLIALDSTDLQAALRSAESRRDAQLAQIEVDRARREADRSTIVAARVRLADAERELNRQKELLSTNDVSQSVVDKAQADVDAQRAQIEASEKNLKASEATLLVQEANLKGNEADIERARDNLSYTRIESPIDGVVTRLNAEVGELVVTGTMNNAGTIIMEVADLSEMILKARVDEAAIASVQVGQKAKIRMEAYRDTVFEGTVVNVPLANFDPNQSRGMSRNMNNNDSSKWFKTEILIDMAGKKILSGLTADCDIQTKHFADIIKVPSQAVLGRPFDSLPTEIRKSPEVDSTKATIPVVFRVIDGKAVITPVTIGASDLTHTVIKSGLGEGDQIITGPYKVLESIQHDKAVKDEKAATTQPAGNGTTKPS